MAVAFALGDVMIAEGSEDRVTDAVEQVMGHLARSFEAFAGAAFS